MDSLGFLEVKGLATSVVACDAMLKASNVTFLNHEYAKGGGWTTIKIAGDVASVQAALDVGVAVAQQYNALVSQTVIARPTEDLDYMIKNDEDKTKD